MKLIVPMYSMRCHKTNVYDILKDGNFKLQVNRMNKDTDIIAVPLNSNIDEAIDVGILTEKNHICLKYDTNAYETRKNFWNFTNNILVVQNFINEGFQLVSDMSGCPLKYDNIIYNFNVSKYSDIDRYYIDEFFERDLNAIRNGQKTYVLNNQQKEEFVKVDSSVKDKIVVDTRVIRKDYYENVGTEAFDLNYDYDIFFPFRLSDKCYRWNEVKKLNYKFLITDPNNSYKYDMNNVKVYKPNKKQFYGILESKPTMIYQEDPSKVFHPGLADLLYFDINIISDHIEKFPKLKDVIIEQADFY